MFNKLFTMADRHKEELGTLSLCRQLASLVEIPRPRLEARLRYLVVGMFQVGGVTQQEVLTVGDSGGSLSGGGISIYYSHTYAQGKAFMASLTKVVESLHWQRSILSR